MKKILIMIIMLFPFVVNAEGAYYDSVNAEISFDQSIDLNKVGGFTIEIHDADYNSYEFELNKENNYRITTKNLFTYSDLSADISGNDGIEYNLSIKIDYSNDMNPVIKVLVKSIVSSTTSGGSDELTTTKSYTEQEIEAAKKSAAARKNRYAVYKIVFLAVLVVIIVFLCIAGIKILNANK